MIRAAQGKKTYAYDQLKLDKKTVLVIDEATMVGTRDMHKLLAHAYEKKAKVVLTGDKRQLPSIAAGTPFNAMLEEHDGFTLDENVRQKVAWLRDAADLYADGHHQESLTRFGDQKRLRFSQTREEAIEGLLHDWKNYRPKDIRDSICLANTNQEVKEINTRIQDERRLAGELGKACIAWNGYRFREGDRIVFRENDRKQKLWNGNIGTIKKLDAKTNRLIVDLDVGSTVDLKLEDYGKQGKVELGYAVTVHRAQGMSVDVSFVLLGDNALTSAESSYVALSRARYDTFINADGRSAEYEDVVVYTEAIEQTAKRLQMSAQKKLAHQMQQAMST